MGARTIDYPAERQAMIDRQLRSRGISDPAILDAFANIPRETFVGAHLAHLAYEDRPLPIEGCQTISQPYIVALMIEAAEIKRGDRILEVGSGSGYAAAVISRIAARIIGIERNHELADIARQRLACLGADNVEIVEGDGTKGWPAEAPYDAILCSASGPHVPASLTGQLVSNGRLVMPVGQSGRSQKLVKLRKCEDGSFRQSYLGAVNFVPLIGAEGWKDA